MRVKWEAKRENKAKKNIAAKVMPNKNGMKKALFFMDHLKWNVCRKWFSMCLGVWLSALPLNLFLRLWLTPCKNQCNLHRVVVLFIFYCYFFFCRGQNTDSVRLPQFFPEPKIIESVWNTCNDILIEKKKGHANEAIEFYWLEIFRVKGKRKNTSKKNKKVTNQILYQSIRLLISIKHFYISFVD